MLNSPAARWLQVVPAIPLLHGFQTLSMCGQAAPCPSPVGPATYVLSAVDDVSRLENDRNPMLRPRWLRRHLRRDFRGQRPRRLLGGRGPHLPAQPRPLQVRSMQAHIMRVSWFCLSRRVLTLPHRAAPRAIGANTACTATAAEPQTSVVSQCMRVCILVNPQKMPAFFGASQRPFSPFTLKRQP